MVPMFCAMAHWVSAAKLKLRRKIKLGLLLCKNCGLGVRGFIELVNKLSYRSRPRSFLYHITHSGDIHQHSTKGEGLSGVSNAPW